MKSKQLFTLFINSHVIPKDISDSKKTITFYYGIKINETKEYIKHDNNKRFIKCYDKPKDDSVI